MVEEIKSVQNSKIKEANKLKLEKYRSSAGLFLIEGYHIFNMALKANVVETVFTNKIIKDLPNDINQYLVTDEILEKLSFMKSNQGIIAICRVNEKDFIKDDTLIYLENIKDPGNLGTILRTSLAFGIKNILISKDSVSIYNPKVIMSSQGAIFDLNIKEISTSDLKEFKNEGYKIASTCLVDKSINIKDYKLKNKTIITFGNESFGISDELKSLSDEFIKIDISNIDSLNVAIAHAITIFYLFK